LIAAGTIILFAVSCHFPAAKWSKQKRKAFLHLEPRTNIMNKKRWIAWTVLVLFVCLLLPLAVGARPSSPAKADAPVTTITVNCGQDINNSKNEICTGEEKCTLRRAIVEARGLPPGDRPVLINFNIPETAEEGYDTTLDVWELEILSSGNDQSVFRTLEGGQITIDGSTQPGGRIDGPKIILVGPATGNKEGIIVGTNASGSHDLNEISGLAFQNFRTHLYVNSNENTITNNWFGLTSDGAAPYLRNGDAQDGSGSGGVRLTSGASFNLISGNVFLGFDGNAAALHGDSNEFSMNYVGTDGSGNVPGKQTDPDLVCTSVDWLGGGGISLEGDGHLVLENIFAGLRQQISSTATQPDAIHVISNTKNHILEGNQIGVDKSGKDAGVCGRGIYLAEPEFVLVKDNTIVNPGLSAISLNGVGYDANTLQGNVIRRQTPWPEDDFNPQPENAIQLGPNLPQALQNFAPARVTKIEGKLIGGTSGPGSPCPGCIVELFLDDRDGIVEALVFLDWTTADSNGNWQVALEEALTDQQGLRTTSTSAKFNTIPGLSAGTTTGLSALYIPGDVPPPDPDKEYGYLPVVFGD
jgi:hypothetical protein